eukprot:UC1_evm1s2044
MASLSNTTIRTISGPQALPDIFLGFVGDYAVDHLVEYAVGQVAYAIRYRIAGVFSILPPLTSAARANQRNRHEIGELLRQALVDLPKAVTSSQETPALQELMERADSADDGVWTTIVVELVPTLPMGNPLASVLIPMILDMFPRPTRRAGRDTALRLIRILKYTHSPAEARNSCIVLGVMADVLAGHTAEYIMLPELARTLLDILRRDVHIVVTLHALFAVEKFAVTRTNKQVLIRMGAPQIIRDLERKYHSFLTMSEGGPGRETRAPASSSYDVPTSDQPTSPAAVCAATQNNGGDGEGEDKSGSTPAARRSKQQHKQHLGARDRKRDRSARAALERTLMAAQVGFFTTWSLDNVFPCPNRQYAVEHTDLSAVNVMLDPRDATPHLKLSPDGLEIRNDALSFESVRATCCASGGGQWYYEVMLLTGGIMQVGWASAACVYQSEDGFGIGDDTHSLSYDGCRQLVWYGQEHISHGQPKWRPGDVLGVYLDFDNARLSFATNGVRMPWGPLPRPLQDRLYPAASLMIFQHVRFNFGNEPYRFPPPVGYRNLNGVGALTSEEKQIVPRLVLLQRMQAELQADAAMGNYSCQICFAADANVRHMPCGHTDFCLECSSQCRSCPLCRADIDSRVPLSEEELHQRRQSTPAFSPAANES